MRIPGLEYVSSGFSFVAVTTVLALPTSVARAQDVEWKHYAADRFSTRYSPADQIKRDNVDQLEVAWRWKVTDADPSEGQRSRSFVATPLMLGGKLYVATGENRVVALDPTTGKKLWVFDPKAYEFPLPAHGGLRCRGLEYWTDGEEERIILATGGLQLIAIDPETGKAIESFGEEGGWTDLSKGLGREIQRNHYNISAPTIVCRDTIIVGSVVNDYGVTQRMPPGHVRGYDVRTGKMKWIFHSIPQEGEFGNDTWENDSWKYTGNTNVWSLMSVDEELGYVYLPFGTPTNDYYGGHRLGDNLFSESLVCLDAETGERVWHYQAVHHGIWDYDFPCAPNLIDITVDGEEIKAVAQVSKQGFTYVFNRVTGEPIWPIVERPVPESTVPGERTAPTQPYPTKPPAFETQGITEETLIDLTDELKDRAREVLKDFVVGPMFTPPIYRGQDGKIGHIQLPGMIGGANWPGATVDPETGILYVQSVTTPLLMALTEQGGIGDLTYRRGAGPIPSLDGLPFIKPPWGRITAIDLNTGDFAWQVPHGDGPRNHPAIRHLDLGRLGSSYSSGLAGAGAMTTKTLLFTNQAVAPIRGSGGGETGFLRAFDKATGEMIFELPFDNAPVAPPMTYVHKGRQYVAFAAGGRGHDKELIAFSLGGERR